MNVYIWQPVVVSDMQWPCPDGFHVPLNTEWQAIYDAGVSLWVWSSSDKNWFSSYLKIPKAWYLWNNGTTKQNINSVGYYWSSSPYGDEVDYSYRVQFGQYGTYPQSYSDRSSGCPVRWIKDTPVTPTSSWTTIYQWTWSAGIFHNSTDWLISISSDWTTWYTIMDKNLWATTVYNYWDTLSESNCGKYYQRWNNYWFPFSWGWTTSSTQVNVTWYWPWNYYESSTWITTNPRQSSANNWNNLRWWVSQWTSLKSTELKNAYVGSSS